MLNMSKELLLIDSSDDDELNDKITARHYCDVGRAMPRRKSWLMASEEYRGTNLKSC